MTTPSEPVPAAADFAPVPASATSAEPSSTEYAVKAATALIGVLPAAEPLTVGTPSPDPGSVPSPGDAAVAILATLDGVVRGAIAVVLGGELSEALRAGGLDADTDLAVVVEPALRAAATTLGPVVLGASRVLDTADATTEIMRSGRASAVPLTAGDAVRGVLLLAVGRRVTDVRGGGDRPDRGLELLHHVEMELAVELGRTKMAVRDLLRLSPGAVVELDRPAGGPADVLVNGRLIARGEVVVVDEDYGIRITAIVSGEDAADAVTAGASAAGVAG
jgi:flagellar motor switch protein FliN/FliY